MKSIEKVIAKYSGKGSRIASSPAHTRLKWLKSVFAPFDVSVPEGAKPEDGIGAYHIGTSPKVAKVYKHKGEWFGIIWTPVELSTKGVKHSSGRVISIGKEITRKSVSDLLEELDKWTKR